jgi:hypothetical protein
MRLILPKTRPDLTEFEDVPLFFLAGPILGGDDWQAEMCRQLDMWCTDCIIVDPTRRTPDDRLTAYAMKGENNVFPHQTAWERYYLRLAARNAKRGCLIFWLPCESKTELRTDGKPYAGDTRGEVGEWRGQMMYNPEIRLIMGAEPDFPGLEQIRRNQIAAIDPDFTIYDSMQAAAQEAVERALGND